MSIQYTAVESTDLDQHLTDVQAMLNDGWQRIGGHVTVDHDSDTGKRARIYTTFMQRGSQDGSINKASVIENQERRLRRVERLIKQIKTLMEGSVEDDVVPMAWAETHMDMLKIAGQNKSQRARLVDEELEREVIAAQILRNQQEDGGK